jgi:5-methyltetrahydrofolate--homocysteine methyltransferase
MTTWHELVASDRPILADGAMGTMLMANGLEFGDPPELWNLEHPEIIRRVQRGYLEAGSSVILTNTFGGSRLRLELHGRADRVEQLNRTAAVLARVEANAADHPAIVAGDIGPSGQIMAAIGGTLTPEIARDVFGYVDAAE